jgi:hypothetical protein
MAGMVVAVRPHVLIAGQVKGIEPRAKRDTGDIYKTDVTLETSSGGQTTVEFWERQGQPSPPLPALLDRVAIVAEISPPSGNFGASFGFVRFAGDNDLDLIASAVPAGASK